MERYFSKRAKTTISSITEHTQASGSNQPGNNQNVEFDVNALEADPGLRQKVSSFHPNIQDEVRRHYILKGPCQPIGHSFPYKRIGGKKRRFLACWFGSHKNWLEYSITKDAVYCLPCYLFKHEVPKKGGGASFIGNGFSGWNKKDRLDVHVGGINSVHNDSVRKCEALMKQSQSIAVALCKQSDRSKSEYRTRLEASIDCITFLIRNGLALRGHDESDDSDNRGNFLELLEFHARGREIIQRVVLENAPKNLQLTSPDIQKDIVHALSIEITKEILKDLGNDFFAILVDEARDVSIKEQMAIVIRYVDESGYVVERFLGISHVLDTRALTLKNEVESLLVKHGLSLSRLRGQGYDGASNMSGQLNGLKTLILDDNPSAYYVHCFAHQLQLTLVAVAKNHGDISLFFGIVSSLITLVGGSCKRLEFVRNAQLSKVARALSYGELETGRGLNQETSLKRPCDTRWGSYFGTLFNLEFMYSAVITALDDVQRDGNSDAKGEAIRMLNQLDTFDFAFVLKLMIQVLAITNELSLALQKKDQDIVNAMHLVGVAKYRLQHMRDNGWDSLLTSAVSFCSQEGINVPNMNDQYVPPGRSRRKGQQITNLHYFRVEVFYTAIDMQLQELNSRFNESNSQLLSCMACLSPCKSFAAFDIEKVIHLAGFYPNEFSSQEIGFLRLQLDSFIIDMKRDERFKGLKGVDELAIKMVETDKHNYYPLVYLLIKLTLVLPVATASVERSFSAMTYIKNKFRNRISDEWLNDCLVGYIEKDVLNSVDLECVVQCFQNMKSRRGSL